MSKASKTRLERLAFLAEGAERAFNKALMVGDRKAAALVESHLERIYFQISEVAA